MRNVKGELEIEMQCDHRYQEQDSKQLLVVAESCVVLGLTKRRQSHSACIDSAKIQYLILAKRVKTKATGWKDGQ